MATYTSNYAWTKPSGNDQVDISVLNGNLDSQDAIMHKAFTNMAQAFSAASTYAVGDIVLYDNVLYKCHTAVTVAGAWTGSTNWQVYKLSEGGGGSSLTAGDYIDITAGVISVKKEKGEYSLERYVLQSTGGGAPKLVVKKYIDSELISTNEYQNNTAHVNIDDTLEIWYSYNPYNWHYKLLVDGVDHSAGYEYEFSYTDTTEYPVDFHISAGDSTDLVTKGDLPSINDQTPTFTEASTRNNIASGEKLSVILGKIQKFFNDLKSVAYSGSFSDLSNKPENANTFQGTIAEWNQLSTAEKKAYDHASIPDSIDGGVTFPANKVVMTGGGSVEDALDTLTDQSGSYKRGIIPPNSSVEIQLPIGGRSYLLYTYADNNTYNAFSILAFFYTGIYKNISIVASTNITITDSIANRVVRLTNNTNYSCNYAIKNI